MLFSCNVKLTITYYNKVNKNNENIEINYQSGSQISIHYPLYILKNEILNYNIEMFILNTNIKTSLLYEKFMFSSETYILIEMSPQIYWSDPMYYNFIFRFSKPIFYYLSQHNEIFSEFIYDWTKKSISDIAHFIPAKYNFQIEMINAHFILFLKEYNWINTQNDNENCKLSIFSESITTQFAFEFYEFISENIKIYFPVLLKSVYGSLYLSELYTQRNILQITDKFVEKQFSYCKYNQNFDSGLKFQLNNENGWINVFHFDEINFDYNYVYNIKYSNQENIKSLQNILNTLNYKESINQKQNLYENTTIHIVLNKCDFKLYGALLHYLLNGFIPNYFGNFTKIQPENVQESSIITLNYLQREENNEIPEFRHYNIKLNINIIDIRACLPIILNDYSACLKDYHIPIILSNEILIEMNINSCESFLQILQGPITILAPINIVIFK